MKKFIFALLCVILVSGTSYGWDRRAHATVAKIAEDHLTPKAKKLLTKYLGGKSIVYYASWADTHKPDMLIELDFQPSNTKKRVAYPHTFEANADCSVYNGMRRGNDYVKNCVFIADKFVKELKKEHKTMNDSLRFHKIAMLVHWLGDMHCPEHIRYPDDQTSGRYDVYFGNKTIEYHKLWDTIFSLFYPWGYSDSALFIDTCSATEIAEITKGDIYDWGKESATASRPTHEYRKGAVIDPRKYEIEFRQLIDSQIRNGGYRLAALLNSIFE